MLQDVNNQLNSVTQHVGTMATIFSVAMAQETTQEDPQQKSREKAISELSRLAFTGSEIVDAATIFAKTPEHMNMMLVLPEILMRDFILKMLSDERKKQG
uniref:MLLE-like domain-containing protein n=1 Tax=Hordeum vulgare subsp. vulgare TaxID=112509 RepID=A0A8I6X9E5_HORVV